MPEALSTAGITWKVYDGNSLGIEDNPLAYFKNFQTNPTLQTTWRSTAATRSDFKHDLATGELPQVSWINTSLNETEHPGNSSAKVGEKVVGGTAQTDDGPQKRLGKNGDLHHLGRERRLLRPRRSAGRAARHARRVPDGARHHERRGRRSTGRSASASACRCSWSRRSPGADWSPRRSTTTPRCCGSSRRASASKCRTSAPGGAKRQAI